MKFALYRVLLKLLLLAALAPAWAGAAATREAPPQFFSLGIGDLAAELEEVRAKGKQALLLVFEQEGCPACLYMQKNVLNRSDVLELYRKHFVSLSLDVNGALPLRDLAGRDMTEKAYSQAAKVIGTPTFVFYDLKGAEIVRVAGALKPDEFLVIGKFVASGSLPDTLTRAVQAGKRRRAGQENVLERACALEPKRQRSIGTPTRFPHSVQDPS